MDYLIVGHATERQEFAVKEHGETLITQNLVISRSQMDWLQAEGRRRQCSASAVAREIIREAMGESAPPSDLNGPALAEGQIWECCRPGLNCGRRVEILRVKDRWVDVRDGSGECSMLRQHFRWAEGVNAKVGYRFAGVVK